MVYLSACHANPYIMSDISAAKKVVWVEGPHHMENEGGCSHGGYCEVLGLVQEVLVELETAVVVVWELLEMEVLLCPGFT